MQSNNPTPSIEGWRILSPNCTYIYIYDFTYSLYNTYQESIKRHIDFMLQFRNWRRSRVVSIRNIWTALKKITSLSFQKWAKLKRDIEYRKKSKGKYIFSYILKKDRKKIGAMNGANVKVHFKSQTNFSWLFSHVLCWGRYFSKSIKFLFHFSHFFSLVCQPEKILIVYPVRVS